MKNENFEYLIQCSFVSLKSVIKRLRIETKPVRRESYLWSEIANAVNKYDTKELSVTVMIFIK